MLRQIQIVDVNVENWSKCFQKAIDSKNPDEIKKLIRLLPFFEYQDQMRYVLFQTIDAEVVLLEIRQKLLEEREKLNSICIV